jgi:serine/threonine protein kinase
MGVVYAAIHAETGTPVALKTVNIVRAERLTQIRREAQALIRLRHPGLVRVLDEGVHDGCPWYAMERVDGQTFADLIRASFVAGGELNRDPTAPTLLTDDAVDSRADSNARIESAAAVRSLPEAGGGGLPRVLGLVQRLCETLAYVHGEGVIHRDLKPANVFVKPSGEPLLVDFGLVLQVGGRTGREVLDGHLRMAGSVRYMAPEQLRGELLDPRCDLYAVGCLLFELVTGRHVFDGAHAQVVEQQLTSPPPRPSEFASAVPPELDRLVKRLLAKDRRDRLGYAKDVAAALGRLGAQAPAWAVPPPRSRIYLYRPPLVGRDASMTSMQEMVQRPLEGTGGVVFLEGESGSGKTRLALEMAKLAGERGVTVVTGTCMALSADASGATTQGAPLQPLKPLLRAIADACHEQGAAVSAQLLSEHGPLLAVYEPALGDTVPHVEDADLCLPPAAAQQRLFKALSDVFTAFARHTPTALIIDDLQWSDELSLGFLEHVGGALAERAPLLIVATIRSEEATPALSKLMAASWATTVAVRRLQGADVDHMVKGMLGMDQTPAAFVRFLARKSEGNPLFVAEYLRMAVAEQVLVRNDEGRWTLAGSAEPTEVLCEALPLPRSMHDLVERRLAQLGATARKLVDVGATLGREFQPAILRRAAEVEGVTADGAIDELVHRHVLEPASNGEALRFTHDKFREVPYAKLSSELRRELHGRVANVLELVRSEPDEGLGAAVLGHHWMEAREPERAWPHLVRAGDLAREAYALDQAIAFYRSASQAIGAARGNASSAASCDLAQAAVCETLGDMLALRGSHEDARAALRQSIDVTAGDAQIARARRVRKIGKIWETEHKHPNALEMYNQAESTLMQEGVESTDEWRSEWVEVNLHRVRVFYWLAQIDEMNMLVARVHPFVEQHGSAIQRSNYYQALVTRDFRLHRYVLSAETLANAKRSLQAALEANAAVEAAFARFVLGLAHALHGDLVEAQAVLSEARDASRRQGDATSEIRSLAYLLMACRRAQQKERVATLAEETLARASALGMKDYVGLAEASLGWLAFKQGHKELALKMSQDALDTWGGLSFVYPFQWNAALTLLAVQLDQAPLRELVKIAEKLLLPAHAGLPAPIADCLASATRNYAERNPDQAHDDLQGAVAQSLALGYL